MSKLWCIHTTDYEATMESHIFQITFTDKEKCSRQIIDRKCKLKTKHSVFTGWKKTNYICIYLCRN